MESQTPAAEIPPPSRAAPRAGVLGSDVVRLSLLTAAIFAVMALLAPERFLSAGNLGSMAFQFPEFAILALAMMLAMLTGGIDLAIIGIANLSAIVAALLMAHFAGPQGTGAAAGLVILLAVLASLGVGALAGLFNGIAIGVLGLPPILATLGSGLIFTGLGVAITGGSALLGLPPGFAVVGNGSLGAIPVPLIIVTVLGVLVALMLERTALGLKMRMFGTNPLAARFAGIDDVAVTVHTYLLSGMLAAAAGLVIMSRANSAKADYGSSYLLLSVLICVLGGINPFGGFGRVAGLAFAVLSLQFLSSGLNMLQVSNFAKELIWGGLLLAVMVANGVQFRRKAR